GLLRRQRVPAALGNHGAAPTDLLGSGHPVLASESAFAIRVEKDGTVHVPAVTVTLPLPDLRDRCRQSGRLRHHHHLRVIHTVCVGTTHTHRRSHSLLGSVVCHPSVSESDRGRTTRRKRQIRPRLAARVTNG